MVTTGSQQGIDLVSKLFIDEGTVVGVECPTYLAATQCFRFFGAQFLELDLTSATFDLPTLRQQLLDQRPAFLYLIPTFQNPTGACYSQAQRMALAALLDELNICLVEDEPYRDLVYDAVDRTPICHYLQRAPWIYLGSFSKIAIPALRIGYLACDPRLYTPLLRLKQAGDLHSNRWAQWLLNEFVQSADYASHITQLCNHYRQQRDLMQTALQQHKGKLGEWAIPAGGLFFWIRLKDREDKPINTLDVLQRALDQGVAFMPGDPFFANAHSRYAALRLNFSHSSAAQIEQGVATLAQLLQTERS
jgi:DNA-binding transcriptional MocR family regulator